jgi:sialidase-1
VSAAAPLLKQTDLFVSGKDGYHTYRIPAIVPAGGNVLLAFCEGRKNSGADAGDIDLLLRRSLDGGETWEKVQIVASNGNFTCGNPCPIVDASDGTIWLLLCKNGADHVEGLITEGKAPRTVWVTKSTDKGLNWSEPIEITKDVKQASWTWYATGPGHGIQLKSGRLLAACDHVNNGAKKRTGHSHAVYSDDHGRSWKIGGIVDPGTNESTAVELSDGSVVINCRNARSEAEVPLGRMCAWSKDGGLTFEKATADEKLIEPICQASILRLSGRGDRVLFSNPASGKREKLTIRMSNDGCKTWPVSRVLNEGHSAYSDLAQCENGAICCFYERGEKNPYQRLTFAKFNVGWLIGQER